MEARTAVIERKTNETDIKVSINLDDKMNQKIKIDTGIGFLDHVHVNIVNNERKLIEMIDVSRPSKAWWMVIRTSL